MSELVVNTLWIYGLAAAVSLLIAALIKLIVVLLGRVDRPAAVIAPPRARPAAAVEAGDARVVAAISAAVYACIGEHRIVHIEDAAHGAGWAAEGRAAHHSAHLPTYRHTPR
jgi:hypothetical protein